MNNTKLISSMLIQFGVPAHLKGYDYIVKAVEMCIEDKSYINSVTKRLYPEIASHFNTTWSRVERAMRHAVETSFNRASCSAIQKLFGCSFDPNRGKPTNSEFIATLAEHCKFSDGDSDNG